MAPNAPEHVEPKPRGALPAGVKLSIERTAAGGAGAVELRIRPRYAVPKPPEDEDERARRVWGKLDEMLASYHLSKFGERFAHSVPATPVPHPLGVTHACATWGL
jgi:hypothetical protein